MSLTPIPFNQRNLVDYAFGSSKRVVANPYVTVGAAAYAAGDLIGNSTTAGNVVPITFSGVTRAIGVGGSAKIRGAKCVVAPATGNVVVTNFDFDLLIFRPTTDMPYPAGSYPADNAALSMTVARYKELVCVIPFVNGAWRNPTGALTAGAVGCQFAAPAALSPAVLDLSDFLPANSRGDDVLALMQARAAWDPSGGAAHTFDFTLFLDQD